MSFIINLFLPRLFFGLIVSFLITLYVIPIFSKIAFKLNFIDVPDGKLKTQAKPVPYLGGLAVFIGFIIGYVLVLPTQNSTVILIPCLTFLLLLGLLDDFVMLKPYQKFFGQVIALICFLKSAVYLKHAFFKDYAHLAFSGLWILSLINAFNLIDVMDGLATLVAVLAAIFFLGMAFFMHLPEIALFLICILGSLLAFFLYNKPVASIYLGDAGSLFLGGIFATLPFLFPWGTYHIFGFLIPVVILSIPLFELIGLICIRSLHKIPFYKGSPHHFSCYLLRKNWSKQMILLLIFFMGLILGILSVAFLFGYIDLIGLSISYLTLVTVWAFILATGQKA